MPETSLDHFPMILPKQEQLDLEDYLKEKEKKIQDKFIPQGAD